MIALAGGLAFGLGGQESAQENSRRNKEKTEIRLYFSQQLF